MVRAMVCPLLLLLAALTTAGLAESRRKSGNYAIAYIGTCGKEEGICSMHSDGSQRRLIVPRGVEPPLLERHGWSPDGRKLVYYDRRAYLVSIEEHRDEELPVPLIGLDIQLVWSPDSKRIAFASPVEAPDWKDPEVQRGQKMYSTAIYVIDVRTKKMSRLTSFGQNRWISWSPDGRQIVFSGSDSGEAKSSIYVVNTAGENHSRRIFSGSTINVQPIWSPQGDQIAFVAAPMPDKNMSDAGVYVIRPDGSAPRRISPVQSSADWSPDGRFLLIASHVVNVENGATVDLGGLGEATFSPDGRSIIYGRDSDHGSGSDQGKGSIGTIDLDGKNRRSLIEVCSFSVLALYRKNYPHENGFLLRAIFATDRSMRRNAVTQAERKVAQGVAPVYMYRWDWPAYGEGAHWGAVHGSDLSPAFANPTTAMTGNSPGGRRLAQQLGSSFAAFAKTGNPNNSNIPTWSPYDKSQRPVMIFGAETRQVNDPARELREMWDKILTT